MSTWLGRRVELQNKKTGEARFGTIVEDGSTRTIFLSDDGERLSADEWHYRPVVTAGPQVEIKKVEDGKR